MHSAAQTRTESSARLIVLQDLQDLQPEEPNHLVHQHPLQTRKSFQNSGGFRVWSSVGMHIPLQTRLCHNHITLSSKSHSTSNTSLIYLKPQNLNNRQPQIQIADTLFSVPDHRLTTGPTSQSFSTLPSTISSRIQRELFVDSKNPSVTTNQKAKCQQNTSGSRIGS